MPYDIVNGPCLYTSISVSTTPVLLKVGASALEERKEISIQPIDGVIYFGFDSSVSSTTGTKIFKGQYFSEEFTETVTIYLVAATGTVNVRITERA